MLLLSFIGLFLWTTPKPLFLINKWTIFYNHSIQFAAVLQDLLNVDNYVFPKKLFLKINIELEQKYIYSSFLHEDLYHKLTKSFNNYIPITVVLKEEHLDQTFEGIVIGKKTSSNQKLK